MEQTQEQWKDIVGYEGIYQVSSIGRIKSLKQKGRKSKGGILKPKNTKRIYLLVNLYKDNIMKAHKVHRLVALHFVPNPHGKSDINHIDGNVFNNQANNLEWCTKVENIWHKLLRNGRNPQDIGLTPTKGGWEANICHNGNNHFCGRYETKELAREAYLLKAHELGVVNKYLRVFF